MTGLAGFSSSAPRIGMGAVPLLRLHLVNAIDLVLSQEPLQGKAIFEQFDLDVQSVGFPTDHSKILDYVEQRYLARVRPQNVKNFGIVLAKSVLKGVPQPWELQRRKIVSSLVAVRDRAPEPWPDLSQTIVRLIDNLEPENRNRAITFIASFPDFWAQLQAPTMTALEETAENTDAAQISDYRMLAAVTLPQFRDALLGLIDNLGDDRLRDAIEVDANPRQLKRSNVRVNYVYRCCLCLFFRQELFGSEPGRLKNGRIELAHQDERQSSNLWDVRHYWSKVTCAHDTLLRNP